MVIGFLVFDFLALVPWYLWLISLALPFLIALQYLILPLIPRGDGTSYMQRVESTVSRKSDPALGAGFYALGERIGQRTVGLLFATILLFSFAYSIGDFVARAQSEFLVDTWEPCAVIRFSSTELLCVEYDAATHKALPSYRLLETHTRLSLRRVGPFPRVESPPSQ
jgi:hypothetical protein